MTFYSREPIQRFRDARVFLGHAVTLTDGRWVGARSIYVGVVISVAYGPNTSGVIVLRCESGTDEYEVDRAFSLATVASIELQHVVVPVVRNSPTIREA